MSRPEFNEDEIGDIGVYAWADEDGAAIVPIHCPECKKLLTKVQLTPWSVVDIKVECMTCGGRADGHNLRTTKMGNIRQGDPNARV